MAHKEKVKVTEIRVEKVTPERCRIRMQKRKAENQQHHCTRRENITWDPP
jgi:hypothetical protein